MNDSCEMGFMMFLPLAIQTLVAVILVGAWFVYL
jgi:hypothetical protein